MGSDRRFGDGGIASGHPIAAKVIRKMKQAVRGKLIDLRSVIVGRATAEELQKQVATKRELAGLHPAHAAYVYAQNQVSVMSEQLTALKEMMPFVDIVSSAENLYLPSGPPMSPLTTSYFTCWAFFDACAGSAHETIGSTILELGAAFGMSPELSRLIQSLQGSRMGLYLHRGVEGSLVVLEDIVTGGICRAIIPGRLSRRQERAVVCSRPTTAHCRQLGARRFHDAVHHIAARSARLAGVLQPHVRPQPTGARRRLRAPHEIRTHAGLLERFRV
jgi:hypothetical protein